MVKYPDWSKEDIKIIKQLGPETTLKELALNFPDKTISQVKGMRIKTIGNKQDKTKWTKEEDAIILKYGKEKSVKELIDLLPIKKSFYKVSDRRLKLIGNVRDEYAEWPKQEDNILIENKYLTLGEYEKLLNFKFNQIQIKRRKQALNLTNRRIVWTIEEIILLKDNRKKPLSELSKLITTKSEKQIDNYKKRFGIRKVEPWSEKDIQKLIKLSKKYEVNGIFGFCPNRKAGAVRDKFYSLGLKNPKNNSMWPQQFRKLYKDKNNNGKPITDYEFRYSKYEIHLECEFGHVFKEDKFGNSSRSNKI